MDRGAVVTPEADAAAAAARGDPALPLPGACV